MRDSVSESVSQTFGFNSIIQLIKLIQLVTKGKTINSIIIKEVNLKAEAVQNRLQWIGWWSGGHFWVMAVL